MYVHLSSLLLTEPRLVGSAVIRIKCINTDLQYKPGDVEYEEKIKTIFDTQCEHYEEKAKKLFQAACSRQASRNKDGIMLLESVMEGRFMTLSMVVDCHVPSVQVPIISCQSSHPISSRLLTLTVTLS